MLSPTLFPLQLISFLLVFYTTAVICINETEIYGKTHSYEFSSADTEYGNAIDKPNEKTVCERSKLKVECEKGQVIHFIKANYGRKTLSKCNPKKNNKYNVKCVSAKSEKIMRERCHRKRSCNAPAVNSFFGDPCPNTEKYLEIQYRCVKETVTKVTTKRTTPKRTTPKTIPPKATTPKPKATSPRRTTPKRITPKRITPKGSTPKVTTPKVTTPKVTAPKVTAPKVTTTKVTTLKGTSPKVATPKATTPKETTPKETTSKVTTPKETTPKETTSNVITPKETTPKVTTPKEITHKETISKEVTPKETTPKETTPKETTPKETTLKETTLKETTLKETTPKETTLKETTPEETTPNGTFVKETTLKVTTLEGSTPEANKPLSISACEHTKLNVACENGKVIHFLRANYGRTTLTKCNPNNVKTWNEKCLSKNSDDIVREKCDRKQSCQVEATNSVFGDPCSGTIKYLEIQYICIPEEVTKEYPNTEETTLEGTTSEGNKPRSATGCEGTKLKAECESGKVIHCIQANYGRTTLSKCNPNNIKTLNVKCLSKNSGEIMRQKCDGKRNCVVEASNSVFGDPCTGTIKYLEMIYTCVPEEVTTTYLSTETTTPRITTSEVKTRLTVHACENTKLSVECDNGKVIDVFQGHYGRTIISKCNPNNIKTWNVNCMSKTSGKIIYERCNGKQSCVIEARNSVFGDPCQDTLKYLEMQYICIPASAISEKISSPTFTNYVSVGITNDVFQSTTKSSEEASPTVPPSTILNTTTTYDTTLDHDIHTTVSDISTDNPVLSTHNPDIPKTVDEISTKDIFIVTTVPYIPTETIKETTTSHEETSDSSASKTSNNPLSITTTTECDEQDLKCLKFKCPGDMGNFPHPASKKLFIFCINWKPRVKSCGTDLLFSEKLMTCVNEKSLFYHLFQSLKK